MKKADKCGYAEQSSTRADNVVGFQNRTLPRRCGKYDQWWRALARLAPLTGRSRHHWPLDSEK
ncbi:MAG: hypothetical protein LBM73_02755 [Candidatus Nomurabacteria bacterium]|jgi:hypothetical protein|nr:hypothetical protein [Candidatus Nomurabacteria bacterium]